MTLVEHVTTTRRTINRLMTARLAKRSARSLVQLRALRVLTEAASVTQTELAARLLVDTAAVSRMIASLESEGLVERSAGRDRRSVHLKITPAGRAEARVLDRELKKLDREVQAHLTAEEVKTFVTLISRVNAALLQGGDYGDPTAATQKRP